MRFFNIFSFFKNFLAELFPWFWPRNIVDHSNHTPAAPASQNFIPAYEPLRRAQARANLNPAPSVFSNPLSFEAATGGVNFEVSRMAPRITMPAAAQPAAKAKQEIVKAAPPRTPPQAASSALVKTTPVTSPVTATGKQAAAKPAPVSKVERLAPPRKPVRSSKRKPAARSRRHRFRAAREVVGRIAARAAKKLDARALGAAAVAGAVLLTAGMVPPLRLPSTPTSVSIAVDDTPTAELASLNVPHAAIAEQYGYINPTISAPSVTQREQMVSPIEIKDEARTSNLISEITNIFPTISAAWQTCAPHATPYISSGNDGTHADDSYHYTNAAIDLGLRRSINDYRLLRESERSCLTNQIADNLGDGYRVIYETPEDNNSTGYHIHIQYEGVPSAERTTLVAAKTAAPLRLAHG